MQRHRHSKVLLLLVVLLVPQLQVLWISRATVGTLQLAAM